ncbi:uncharacterized protein LOC129724027 [Wyeomyia smithii]|uniref:uncharacterized protein LOC129724027 n=1 Tax=Wyeomyia smithii TaxID=174621 RepID=UPI0024680534|nr:uncharacterized protein LOC129724027 [Wyeomyia smithii]
MLPMNNAQEVQNKRIASYGNMFSYYSEMQSVRYNITGNEPLSLTPANLETSFNLWPSFTNSNESSPAASQSFIIDVAGMQEELIKTCRTQDTEQIRQDFIRNGIDSAVNGKSTMKARPVSGIGTYSSVWPKNPLSNLDNQILPGCFTLSESTETLPLVDNTHTRFDRFKRNHKENEDYCVFCFNNGESQDTYMGHACRNEKGHVMCPRLQRYICPYCRATGVFAHTKKYCPQKPIITPADLEKMVSGKSSAAGNRGRKALRF